MNKRSFSILAATALLLGGCAIGPDYARPQMSEPDAFRYNDTNRTAIDTQWWKQFHDPKLNDAVETALKANYDLQASQASVDALLGKFDQAKSYLYPQINGSGSLTRKWVDNAAASSGSNLREGVTSTYAASLSLSSYEIDLFGKVRRANEAARALLLAGEYSKETLKLSVAANVAASYVKIASLQSQIVLAKENVDASQEIYRITELKYRHGTIAQTILLQAESEYENAQATLSQLEAALHAEESTYNVLLGRNPMPVDTSSLDTLVVPGVPAAIPSSILEHRPDIASAEQNLIAANAQIGVAKAKYFPSISLTGMMGIQSMELSQFVSNPTRLWELAPSINVPLFTAGRISGEVRTAEAERDQMVAAYKKAIVSAFNDTDNALGQVSKAKEQNLYQGKRSLAIEQAFKQAQLQYNVGTISYDTLLGVQQQWLQAKQSYLISKQNSLTSMIALYKSLGGGWNEKLSPVQIDYYPAGR